MSNTPEQTAEQERLWQVYLDKRRDMEAAFEEWRAAFVGDSDGMRSIGQVVDEIVSKIDERGQM